MVRGPGCSAAATAPVVSLTVSPPDALAPPYCGSRSITPAPAAASSTTKTTTTTRRRRRSPRWSTTASAHPVQPGHGGTVTGPAERLQRVVPGHSEELINLVGEGLPAAGGGGQVTQLILADHDVPVGAGAGAP